MSTPTIQKALHEIVILAAGRAATRLAVGSHIQVNGQKAGCHRENT